MEPNHIYQFSLINALMSGISDTGITASDLLSKSCNQGLGTFSHMDGELVLLDDKIYQLQPEGKIRESAPTDQIPFAMATNFVAQKQHSDVTLKTKDDVDAILQRFNPHTTNLFMTYRIDGHFSYLKCRTIRGQEYPGQPLSELGKKQSIDEYEGVQGTIIGFRSPENWQGFSVAGEHMHFLSHDRKHGGHVLEIRDARGLTMGMAVVSNVHVELPKTTDFNDANLVTDSEGVKQVEG